MSFLARLTSCCDRPCCGVTPEYDVQQGGKDDAVHATAVSAEKRIRAAEITLFVVTLIAIALTITQVLTNFASPATIPGHVAQVGINALATKLFIAAAAVTFVIGLALEAKRRKADKYAQASKGPGAQNPPAGVVPGLEAALRGDLDGLNAVVGQLRGSPLRFKADVNSNALHVVAGLEKPKDATQVTNFQGYVKGAIEALVKAASADALNAKDADGNTPLEVAKNNPDQTAFEALKAVGKTQLNDGTHPD